MAVLGGGTGFVETEAGGGVANLRMASGRRLLQRRTTGEHSRSDLNMPYLHLNALSSGLQEVAAVPRPLTVILNVVRH